MVLEDLLKIDKTNLFLNASKNINNNCGNYSYNIKENFRGYRRPGTVRSGIAWSQMSMVLGIYK